MRLLTPFDTLVPRAMDDPKLAPDRSVAPARIADRFAHAGQGDSGEQHTAPLEVWTPEARHARIPLAASTLAPLAVTVVVALATHSLLPLAAAAFGLLIWWMVRGGYRRGLLTQDVSFELTRTAVRVRAAGACRQIPLSEIETVSVVSVSRTPDVGHVVLYEKGRARERPAIPTGRRVNAGTVGLVTWANVDFVDPADQLFEGALTFWFVPHPEMVRERLLAALAGMAPNARGAHR